MVQRLQDEMPHAKFERRSIAHLLAQLMQFMEDALGINVGALMPVTFLHQAVFRRVWRGSQALGKACKACRLKCAGGSITSNALLASVIGH